MKKIAFLLHLLFVASTVLMAQKSTIVQGICKNDNGKAVENVSVYVRDSVLVSITDENGCFAYHRAKAGDKLRFVHMAYESMRIDLKTGTAKPVLDLSGYPFAEMIRINNGIVYFLYPTGNNHRQALYQVKIE